MPCMPLRFTTTQILKRPDDALLAFLLGTAIGVMFLLSIAEMWIHNAMQHGWPAITGAALCGALLYQVIQPFLPNFEGQGEASVSVESIKVMYTCYIR